MPSEEPPYSELSGCTLFAALGMPARHAYIQEQISASGNALYIALGKITACMQGFLPRAGQLLPFPGKSEALYGEFLLPPLRKPPTGKEGTESLRQRAILSARCSPPALLLSNLLSAPC